ncbi:hypothetical protein DPMN_000656 [Dreissena polymorpha]|uniref:Uncharacterized protein n=1 Tax=Dreissena polymorpha TaxID=45954 RepID=A0A9D4MJZ9_DREPO|nr:hypothetical protein DPMN_000656 [Dreissena polymorpha]
MERCVHNLKHTQRLKKSEETATTQKFFDLQSNQNRSYQKLPRCRSDQSTTT